MTWQEDLRQLDARLANGDIGAADYRKSRDEILAEASSGNQASGRESPKEGLWTSANPTAQDETTTETSASGETTVVVRVDTPEEEKTQIVTADQLEQPTRPVGPSGPPQKPWPGSVPGQVPQRSAPIQGQEVFSQTTSGGSGRWLRFAIPLLIVALVATGLWWFVFRDDNSAPQAETPSNTTSSQPSTEQPPTDEPSVPVPGIDEVAAAVPALPGDPWAENGLVTADDALRQELLDEAYTTLLKDNGAPEMVFQKSSKDGLGFQVLAAPVQQPDTAPQLAELMNTHLREIGFESAEPAESAGLPVLTRTDPYFRTFVAIYSSGGVWIQLNASGKPDADESALRAEFESILTGLTAALPAG